ncbi:MAG: TIGR04282 family arsenosugar biosynthesis glycosyltransferase [Nocardioidaceae bacterium]
MNRERTEGTRVEAEAAVLVMAKAPVPGFAKTRLAATVGPTAAADLATDSLLDTLAAAAGTGWPVVVALTGDIDSAPRAAELRTALAPCLVIEQRGHDLGERLAAAHADAMAVANAVVQIGSDTPQVEPGDLVAAHDRLAGHDAVLGPASDGGWWLLATRRPAVADCLARVPMSRVDTGARTMRALGTAGWRVGRTKPRRDVDTARDAEVVARLAPGSRFAARWAGQP